MAARVRRPFPGQRTRAPIIATKYNTTAPAASPWRHGVSSLRVSLAVQSTYTTPAAAINRTSRLYRVLSIPAMIERT